jgi:hypothetical protein
MKTKRKVSTDLIYLQKLRIWSVSRPLRHVVFVDFSLLHNASVSTASSAAHGSYRLCREGQQEGSIGASVLTLEPVLQGHSSQTWSTFFQIFFGHATARTLLSYGLPACAMLLHRWFVNILLSLICRWSLQKKTSKSM